MQLIKWVYEHMHIKGQCYPRSLIQFFSNLFFLETAMPIEAKFHVQPAWDEGLKENINSLCNMTKMAAMPLYPYMVKTFEICFSETKRPMTLKLGFGIDYSCNTKKVNRKVQCMPKSQTAARQHEEEKKDKNIHAQKKQNKCTRSRKTSSLFPKRGDQNAKTNGETRTESTRRF